MVVTLKWRRLPRKRGGWRFGLSFSLQVEYGEEEKKELAPDWSVEISTGNAPRFWSDPRQKNTEVGAIPLRIRNNNSRLLHSSQDGWGVRGKITPETTLGGKEIYFDSAGEREEFIAFLHRVRDAVKKRAQDWWHENPPVPGDEESFSISEMRPFGRISESEIESDGQEQSFPVRRLNLGLEVRSR
jgi:hypothetical protein